MLKQLRLQRIDFDVADGFRGTFVGYFDGALARPEAFSPLSDDFSVFSVFLAVFGPFLHFGAIRSASATSHYSAIFNRWKGVIIRYQKMTFSSVRSTAQKKKKKKKK